MKVAHMSGLAGLFAGLILAGSIANACVSWYPISSREGAHQWEATGFAGRLASRLPAMAARGTTSKVTDLNQIG